MVTGMKRESEPCCLLDKYLFLTGNSKRQKLRGRDMFGVFKEE